MGKKQHQKDKLWITNTEWNTLYGGKRASSGVNGSFKRLPFDCCCITFQPFKNPYCTQEGIVFDLENIFPFIKKYGLNPVTGKKMKAGNLFKLNFSKNAEGKYHCPITFKVFNQNTHIVCVKPSGNVYCYEAVDLLNVKAKNMFDLLTSEPFCKGDIITIQDPTDLQKFNISAFYHVKKNSLKQNNDNSTVIRSANLETKETLAELEHSNIEIPNYMYSNYQKTEVNDKVRDIYNTAHYSTGKAAASSTSTVMEPVSVVEPAILENDIVRYTFVKTKGFVRLITSHGNINIELHCDLVPKTCENFLKLCESGYYTETTFHRLIRHFIIQGGDPSGTGLGGDSFWGGSFADEFISHLKHDARGVLSSANSGPNTNKSQFFITFRPCNQLNKKHTVFGKVVGGLETLDKIEMIETDKDDKPLEEIKILACEIFTNPFREADELLERKRALLAEKETKKQKFDDFPKPGNRREELALASSKNHGVLNTSTVKRQGIGKFIGEIPEDEGINLNSETVIGEKRRHVTLRSNLSDFSGW